MKLKELLPVLDPDIKLVLREQEKGYIISTDLCECYRRSSTLEYYKDRDVENVSIYQNRNETTSFRITLAK